MFLVDINDLLYFFITLIVLVLIFIVFIISRLKKCPADKVMVVLGKVGKNADGTTRSFVCIHGGVMFIYPFIQTYQFLDLNPINIDIDLIDILDSSDIKVNKPSKFSIGISTEFNIMENAAERLLGLSTEEIKELSKDIIYGQIRLTSSLHIDEIYSNSEKFLEIVLPRVEAEISKIGLKLINFKL